MDKVKGIYWGNCHWPWASAKYARLNDGSGMVWDNDSGTKLPCDCAILGNQPHMRVYADDNDTLYNTSWGFLRISGSNSMTKGTRHVLVS